MNHDHDHDHPERHLISRAVQRMPPAASMSALYGRTFDFDAVRKAALAIVRTHCVSAARRLSDDRLGDSDLDLHADAAFIIGVEYGRRLAQGGSAQRG